MNITMDSPAPGLVPQMAHLVHSVEAAIKSKLLDSVEHRPLIADIDRYCHMAGVPKSYVLNSATKFCSEAEIEWLRHIPTALHDEEIHGLLYCGEFEDGVIDRMMSIVGACLRNYIDARYMPLAQVLDHIKDGSTLECSVLAIPNFFIPKQAGGDVASWKLMDLYNLLIDRASSNKLTILYVQDWKTMAMQYGEPIAKLLGSNYSRYEE